MKFKVFIYDNETTYVSKVIDASSQEAAEKLAQSFMTQVPAKNALISVTPLNEYNTAVSWNGGTK